MLVRDCRRSGSARVHSGERVVCRSSLFRVYERWRQNRSFKLEHGKLNSVSISVKKKLFLPLDTERIQRSLKPGENTHSILLGI